MTRTRDCTIDRLLEEYLELKEVAEATARSYTTAVRVFKRDMDPTSVRRITVEELAQWRNEVLARASGATWNTYLRHLRALFNFAVKRGYRKTNPFLEIDLVRTPRKRKRVIEDDAILYYQKALQDREDGWFWWTVTLTFYYTGIRRRQLVGLQWSDIDLEGRVILLRSETSKNYREWRIPITEPLREPLLRLREKTRAVAGRAYLRSGQVFNITLFNPAYAGDQLTETQLSDFYNRLRRRSGGEHAISPHRFRHRFATELVRRAPPKYVQELMGHTSIHTTLEYVEVEMDDLRKTAEQMPLIPDQCWIGRRK